jgi:3-dehydroquinate synthase
LVEVSAELTVRNEASQPDIYLQRFAVRYEYPVCFTRDLFAVGNSLFADILRRNEPDRRHRFAAFIDAGLAAAWPSLAAEIANYAQHHAEHLDLVAPAAIVPGGEQCKNDSALVERLQRSLVEIGLDRHSYVVAIGGGAVLDLVGYAAATVHRGIRLVRVPTTVLAQDDSGVGVKNGVNAFGLKNLLGTFVPPFAVLNDSTFLAKLDRRDRIAGMAEAVKVALIRDGTFFAWLEAHADDLRAGDADALDRLIWRCAQLHMRQIADGGDPFEAGSARPLDYGHWAAHKLEALTHHVVRHGEAVAIGIALDARYSVLSGLLPAGAEVRICSVLERLGFELWHPALETREGGQDLTLLAGLREFREHLGGELTITLLAGIGQGVEVHDMDEALILRAIRWLKTRAAP